MKSTNQDREMYRVIVGVAAIVGIVLLDVSNPTFECIG